MYITALHHRSNKQYSDINFGLRLADLRSTIRVESTYFIVLSSMDCGI